MDRTKHQMGIQLMHYNYTKDKNISTYNFCAQIAAMVINRKTPIGMK